jgi:hypothetical protein
MTLEIIVPPATIAIRASLILQTFGKIKRPVCANQSKIQFCRYVCGFNISSPEYGFFPRTVALGSDLGSESIVAFSLIDSENLICPL